MKKYYKILTLLLSLFLILSINIRSTAASINTESITSYYSGISSTLGSSLANELNSLISSNTSVISYSNLYTKAYPTTDVMPGTDIVWDIYSNEIYDITSDSGSSATSEGMGFNREHTVPQSWFSKASPMVSDIYHVYPTDIYVNNQRSSYVYDDVSSASKTYNNGSKLGTGTIFSSKTTFEIADEYKGDIARGYFYMAIRYKDKLSSWTSGEAQNIFSSSYPYLTSNAISIFTKWSHLDPVSDKEMIRNDAIYSLQNNRNPFIDHPEWIDTIWTNSYTDSTTNTQYSLNNVISAISSLSSSSSSDSIYEAYNKYVRLTVSDKENVSNASTLFSLVESASGTSEDLDSYWESIISTYKSLYSSSSESSNETSTSEYISVSKSSFSSVSGSLDSYISYKAEKGSAATSPKVYNNIIRVYQNGGTFTISATNSNISSISLGSAMATSVTYKIDSGSTSSYTSISANGVLTIDNLNCETILFTCVGTTSKTRLYVNYLSVTYNL